MQMLWAEIDSRPILATLLLVILVVLLVAAVSQVIYSRTAMRRHKALMSSLEKGYYYQQEIYARLNAATEEIKGQMVSRDADFERLLQSLAEKLRNIDAEALGRVLAGFEASMLLDKIEEMMSAQRELLDKQGVFIYDEITALSAKTKELGEAMPQAGGESRVYDEIMALSAKTKELGEAMPQAGGESRVYDEIVALSAKTKELGEAMPKAGGESRVYDEIMVLLARIKELGEAMPQAGGESRIYDEVMALSAKTKELGEAMPKAGGESRIYDEVMALSAKTKELGEAMPQAGGESRVYDEIVALSAKTKELGEAMPQAGGESRVYDEIMALSAKIKELGEAMPQAGGESRVYDEIVALSAKIKELREAMPKPGGESQMLEKIKNEWGAELSQKLSGITIDRSGGETSQELLTQAMKHLAEEVDAKMLLLTDKLEKTSETKWREATSAMENSISSSLSVLREQIVSVQAISDEIKQVSADVASISRILQSGAASAAASPHDDRQYLPEILPHALQPEFFKMDYKLPNGWRADAVVRFLETKDSVAIDAALPLGFFDEIATASPLAKNDMRRCFREDLIRHIGHVADNLIVPPHTGKSALLFVPSESAFAEIQKNHTEAVRLAKDKRVLLVSPSSLITALFGKQLSDIGDHVNSAWRNLPHAEKVGTRLMDSIRGGSDALPNDDVSGAS